MRPVLDAPGMGRVPYYVVRDASRTSTGRGHVYHGTRPERDASGIYASRTGRVLYRTRPVTYETRLVREVPGALAAFMGKIAPC